MLSGNLLFMCVWLVAIVGLIALGIMWWQQKRRGLAFSALASGTFLLLVPVAFVAAWFMGFGNKVDSMSVEPLDPPNQPWFEVSLRHDRTFDSGTEYWFGNAGSIDKVLAAFEAQHPDGVVTTASPEPLAQGEVSIWHLSTDDVRYELTTGATPDWYGLTTQMVVVDPASGSQKVRIAFPRSAFNVTEVTEGEARVNNWTVEQWSDFYSGMDDVATSGDTITVPTNRGGTATITFDGATYSITINN